MTSVATLLQSKIYAPINVSLFSAFFDCTFIDFSRLSLDGTLTISGKGDMPDFVRAPWYNEREKITNVVIKDGVTSIGSKAFLDCDFLASVTIPDSVTTIGDWAFNRCIGLTSVTIPDSVTSIGSYAFGNCSGLKSVTIGSGVTSVGSGAFCDCGNIELLLCKASVPPRLAEDALRGIPENTIIVIPQDYEDFYAFSDWMKYADKKESPKKHISSCDNHPF